MFLKFTVVLLAAASAVNKDTDSKFLKQDEAGQHSAGVQPPIAPKQTPIALVDSTPKLLNTPPPAKTEEETEAPKEEEAKVEETPTEEKVEETEPVAEPMEVPPVSTTMRCVINMSIQYFIIYTCLAVVRTCNEFTSNSFIEVEKIVQQTTATVNFVPMLCVLFLGVRMRAVQLSQGKTEEHELPQWWVQWCMEACTWSVLVQTVMIVAIPVVLGPRPTGEKGLVPFVIVTVRYAAMLALYGGFTCVCIGACAMVPPKEIWGDEAVPVSPAVQNTINLSIQYFGIYLAVALLQTVHQFGGASAFTRKLEGVINLAKATVALAPMLSILFIGARIRALQIDPMHGSPQKWAQTWFFICAYSVLAQLVLCIVVPLCFGGEVRQGESEGDVTFEVKSGMIFWVLTVLRYGCMLAVYGGVCVVVYSVCVIRAAEGPTPPISIAMLCVMNLTLQYFFLYALYWVFVTLRQLGMGGDIMGKAIRTLDAGKATVVFCPMLCVLFLGLRLRARQVLEGTGEPQPWAQQGMNLATRALVIQLAMVLLMPFFTGDAPKTTADGNVEPEEKEQSSIFAYVVETIRYIAMLLLYGGAVVVIVAVCIITPETAAGKGPLIPVLPESKPFPIPGTS